MDFFDNRVVYHVSSPHLRKQVTLQASDIVAALFCKHPRLAAVLAQRAVGESLITRKRAGQAQRLNGRKMSTSLQVAEGLRKAKHLVLLSLFPSLHSHWHKHFTPDTVRLEPRIFVLWPPYRRPPNDQSIHPLQPVFDHTDYPQQSGLAHGERPVNDTAETRATYRQVSR